MNISRGPNRVYRPMAVSSDHLSGGLAFLIGALPSGASCLSLREACGCSQSACPRRSSRISRLSEKYDTLRIHRFGLWGAFIPFRAAGHCNSSSTDSCCDCSTKSTSVGCSPPKTSLRNWACAVSNMRDAFKIAAL